ncbi:MAG: putative sulfate/molybdate transporter [Gammaproteobacteria bacterium]
MNRFGRTEWAGAFGDLGTLIPFVVAYVNLLGMDPAGILLAFGIAKVCSGLWYRTPFPVQPMKAIGAAATTQATQNFVVTPAAVYSAGLVTGIIWLVLAVTGLADRLSRITPKAVVAGIVVGLGLKFMGQGIGMMSSAWWLGLVSLGAALALLGNRRVPAMFALLLLGAAAALLQHPDLAGHFLRLHPHFQLPGHHLPPITPDAFAGGALLLALPQLPLTLGNALIAITDENNRLFPDRPVTERRVAFSTGVMNLLSPLVGGVPMCHGAGGMAGHVRFGARTGGALIILGAALVVLALFFSQSVMVLLSDFPSAVLGVILFLAGAQLALGAWKVGPDTEARLVAVVTTGFALWNVGAAFLAGLILHHLLRRGWVRL